MDTTTERPPKVSFWRAVAAIIWKDLTVDLRNREVISAMFVFSLLVVLIFNFALDMNRNAQEDVAVGVLWVTFMFAATLGINRTFAAEKDRNTLDGLLLAPVDRSAIYFGKMLSALTFVLIVEVAIMPVFTILYNVNLLKPLFFMVVFLGTIGYVVVGTLLAAMAVHTRAREVMLPILLFPVTMPVLLASVRTCEGILTGLQWSRVTGPFNLIVAYDIIFLAISYMTFEYLVEE